MKHIFLILLVALFFTSCQKSLNFKRDTYLEVVQKSLKDSLSDNDYHRLDFNRASLTKVDSIQLYVLRIPFRLSSRAEDFVIVKTTSEGSIERGKIIHLEGNVFENKSSKNKIKTWVGTIQISSLDRVNKLQSSIVNGFITAFHANASLKSALVQPGGVLPEVVITYVLPKQNSSEYSFSTWFNWSSLFEGGSSSYYGFYDSYGSGGSSGGGSSGGASGGSYSGGVPIEEEVIGVDFESVLDKSEIDLQKFINCFNSIPDDGARCSIELFADIPVDSDPNKIFSFNSQSPGHTFLQIKKSYGSQSAVQNIGFYPTNDWKTMLTTAPVDGKFVDNGSHEYNTSIFMSITPTQLQSALTYILSLKDMDYDIDNFNCTDWALDVFNRVRINKLEIPLYHLPGNVTSVGTRTPNGVYNKLREMKVSGHAEASNINYNFLKGFAANSTGPCD